MNITFTFRHMDASDPLKRHAADKLEKMARYEDSEMTVHATFWVEKFLKSVEFTVHGAHGTFVARETRDEMLEAIDLAIDKLDRQLSRDKSRRKHHKGHQGSVPDQIG